MEMHEEGDQGRVHISYYDEGAKTPIYISQDVSGAWIAPQMVIDCGWWIGHWNSMALDHYGRPQFVYSHQATTDTKHAGVLRGPYFPWILYAPAMSGMGTTPPAP